MARSILMARRVLAGLALFGAAAASGSAWAESVQQTLSQLANASPNATQLGLRSRGYALAASDAAGERAWQYWWNGREAACVVMATTGSRVDRLASSSETDCNQMDVDSSRMTGQGKVAVAAARQLGVSSLMHKSHQRDTKRYNTTKTVADFELGYRDAVDRADYRDRDRRNTAYADGHKAGQAHSKAAPPVVAAAPVGADYQTGFRDGFNQSAYRDGDRDRERRNNAYASGYKAGQAKSAAIVASGPDYELGFRDGFNMVDSRDRERKNKRYIDGYKAGRIERESSTGVAARPGSLPTAAALPAPTRAEDLVGRNARDLDGGMKGLGYKELGRFKSGRESFTTWRGKSASDCLRILVRDGTVKTVSSIDETNCR